MRLIFAGCIEPLFSWPTAASKLPDDPRQAHRTRTGRDQRARRTFPGVRGSEPHGLGGWTQTQPAGGRARHPAVVRAQPESLCPVCDCARSPLPGGRVDLRALLSGYIYSGFALVASGANVHDVKLLEATLKRIVCARPRSTDIYGKVLRLIPQSLEHLGAFVDDHPCSAGKCGRADDCNYAEPHEENLYADEYDRHRHRHRLRG